MDETAFVDSLRHYLPEAETFLLDTLSIENLSSQAASTLSRIQERLNLLIQSSDYILSPPAGFGGDDVILTPQASSSSSSQIADFSLQIDSDTSSVKNTETTTTTTTTTTPTTTTTTTTNSRVPRKLKQLKRIKIRRKRQRNSSQPPQKRIKVLSGEDDASIDGDISFSPINCEDNESSDIVEPPRQFTHDSSVSSSSVSDTTSSSSSCPSSPLTREPATNNNDDLVNLYVSSEEAFPPSENNTPEFEPVCDTQIVQKRSIKSRLGVRADTIDTEIEIPPSLKFRPKFDIVKNLYPDRQPLKCNDCHKDIPLVTQEQFKCKHCLFKYCTRIEFDSHVTEGESICLHCKITHNTECQRNIHMSKHPKIQLCKDCISVREARSEDKSDRSDRSDRSGPSHSADGTYYCPKCSMKFKTNFDLNTHRETVHSKLTNSPLLLESDQALPERPTPQPVPKLVRAATHELEPNCELQISKDDAAREFDLLRQRRTF